MQMSCRCSAWERLAVLVLPLELCHLGANIGQVPRERWFGVVPQPEVAPVRTHGAHTITRGCGEAPLFAVIGGDEQVASEQVHAPSDGGECATRVAGTFPKPRRDEVPDREQEA